MSAAAVSFAVVAPALLVAHTVADHWIQTDHQATNKGRAGWPGRAACLAHVAGYTAVTALAVLGVWWLFALPLTPLTWLLAAALITALTTGGTP